MTEISIVKEECQERYKPLDEIQENICIEGDFGFGKTALSIILLENLINSSKDNLYSNMELNLDKFNFSKKFNIKNYIKYNKITFATFLNIKRDSIALIDEIHKVFDKRDFIKNKKNTQSLQEIRKFGYKLIGTCSRANMLDFRYLRTTSDIIKCYGNLDLIYQKKYYEIIPIRIIKNLFSIINERNWQYIFLYEFEKYIENNENTSLPVIERTGEYFTVDIRKSFEKYNRYEKIQKMSFITDYT